MKNNIVNVENIQKQKTFAQDYLSNEINKKVDSILRRSQILYKKKSKNLMNNWEEDDNKEYYENFLIQLKAERKKSNTLFKSGLKIERKRKSKTLKLNDDEKKKVKTALNKKRRKSMFHSLLRKSLIFKKKPIIENIKEEKLEPIIESPSLQMSNNIQLFFKETPKKKVKISFETKDPKQNNDNDNIHIVKNSNKIFSSLITKENPYKKEFNTFEKNNRIFTFDKLELNEKKREEIIKGVYDKIMSPVEKSFISNATKIEFKNNSLIENNIKNNIIENDNKKIEIDTNGNNDNNVFIYTIKDERIKKKKFFCCCIPLKFS